MSSMSRRSRVLSLLLASGLVLSTPLLLGGCSAIEGIVEEQTGGDVDLGGNEVPADFPAEVPLIEGEVIFGATLGNDTEKVWNVTIKVGEGALDQITAQLEGAGFAATPVTETPQGSAVTFTKDTFGVLVVVGGNDEGDTIANYTVTKSAA